VFLGAISNDNPVKQFTPDGSVLMMQREPKILYTNSRKNPVSSNILKNHLQQ